MNEYTLNRLSTYQLAEFALRSATLLATVTRPTAKMELYYINRHFIEICYSSYKVPGQPAQWRLYSANHFPDDPSSTEYLTIYLQQIKLSVD
ncbi:hypothetical protein [Spirosoma sp.]|uniref:hypothetical protein n=1 Tax=Spirosoma sp. TaxID=1899569 RepID=UPI003B3AABF0